MHCIHYYGNTVTPKFSLYTRYTLTCAGWMMQSGCNTSWENTREVSREKYSILSYIQFILSSFIKSQIINNCSAIRTQSLADSHEIEHFILITSHKRSTKLIKTVHSGNHQIKEHIVLWIYEMSDIQILNY